MKLAQVFRPWQLLFGVAVFALLKAAKPSWLGLESTEFRPLMLGSLVVFLLFGGSYVLLTTRQQDLDHYKATCADTPEGRRRLQQRYNTIGYTAWALAAGGVVATLVLVDKFV